MDNQRDFDNTHQSIEAPAGSGAKKRYQKPTFRHERVFETRALTCGKVQSTQGSCTHNRHTS
jgi:hypothetical protein